MAMKTKARRTTTKTRSRRNLAPYDYLIKLEGRRVVIDGANGGNIRARGQQWVKFACDPATVPGFKITCTEFQYNDQPGADPAWPFTEAAPAGWVTELRRQLRKPEKGASQLVFKYTIEANVDGSIDADPIIIVDR